MYLTIEELERAYAEGKVPEKDYLNYQAVLGTEAEGAAAFDENGNFHCINWFNCCYCPARNHCEP